MLEFLLKEIFSEIVRQILRRVPYRPTPIKLSRGWRYEPAKPETEIKRVSEATATLRKQLAAMSTLARRSTAVLS